MCEANSFDSMSVRGIGESLDRTFCDSDALSLLSTSDSVRQQFERAISNNPLESLILAQDERWRRA